MSNILKEIEAKESELRKAMVSDDLASLDNMIHPELVFTGPDGGWAGKADDLAAHQAGVLKISKLDFGKRQIRTWGDTAAVVVDAEMGGMYKGQPFSGRYRYTRIWRRNDGVWQVIVGHCSQVG